MTLNEASPPIPSDELTPEQLERGRLLFARAVTFEAAAANVDSMPEPGLSEVAFAGRSNVGKSSLVNALVGHKAMANVSATPGRTQQIVFFDLGGRMRLVDLPGYGYARAPKHAVAQWTKLIEDYLRGRVALRRALILIDARHGLKDSDRAALDLLDGAAVPTQIVLTKADKAGVTELAEIIETISAELRKHPAAMPQIVATSALKGTGIPELRARLATLAI